MSFVGQYSEILASGCVGRRRTLGDDYQRSTRTCKCICTCFFFKGLWLDLTMSCYSRDLIKVVYVRKMVKEIGRSWHKEDQHFARAPSQVMKLWKHKERVWDKIWQSAHRNIPLHLHKHLSFHLSGSRYCLFSTTRGKKIWRCATFSLTMFAYLFVFKSKKLF